MKPTEKLPIEEYKEIIKQAVAEHDVVVITAETGAGKSTQVPQYLMEAGHQVVVTQPRRLAARTVAARVAEELSYRLDQADQVGQTRGRLGDVVGYRTAFERKDSPDNKILFCTDGLQMVRELLGNQQTDVLVIDEVHEWNINIETLVAWTRQQISKGRKMKLVLMSATMEAEKLAKYYGEDTPVISVPGRLYPVSESQVGPRNMISKIQEMVKNGRNVLVFQPGKKEIAQTIEELEKAGVDAEILPLHGELTPEEQKRCFKSYGKPKVVVSTNVAQTSVTIPDIDAVVDSGMERRVELSDGIEGLYLKPISNADRMQRKGRAGRCKEGEYVLASEIDAEDRPDFPKAEIERSRLDQLVLRLASIGFDATELEFFHQPEKKVLEEAKCALHALGAMNENGEVTKVGRLMSKLPLSVQYSRMLVEAQKHNVTDDVLTLVSILEVGGLRAKGNEWKAYTQETESDLLAELDLWNAAQGKRNGELREMGIFSQSFYRAKELRKKLEGELRRNNLKQGSSGDRQAILKACVSGMVDHLYQNRGGDYRNGDSSYRQLARESVVQEGSEWIVGQPKDIQFKNRKGRLCILNLVGMATKVDPKWLIEVAPQLVSTKQERFGWNSEEGEVTADEVTIFNGNEVGRKPGVSAKPSEGSFGAMAEALINNANHLPETLVTVHENNRVLMEFSRDFYLRSEGKAKEIDSTDLKMHYAKLFENLGILSIKRLEQVIESGALRPEMLEVKLEDYISAEDQSRIEAENPSHLQVGGKSFAINYSKGWNGFERTIIMTIEELNSLADDETLSLPSGKSLTIKVSDKGYESLSATTIGDLKMKLEECRLKGAWAAFRQENAGESTHMTADTELPKLPAPKVFDAETGAMAYPANYNYYGDLRIDWFRSAEEAANNQERTEKQLQDMKQQVEEKMNFENYKAEAEAIAAELTTLIERINAEALHEDYGFTSSFDSDFNRLTGYNFRSTVNSVSCEPLKAKERLLAIKKELEDRFETAKQAKAEAEVRQAEIDKFVEAGEILVNFEAWHRRGGMSGNGDGWVIRPDGTLREADSNDVRRYKSDGTYTWNLVSEEELALKWACQTMRNVSGSSDFDVVKLPVGGCTLEQLAAIEQIESEIGAPQNAFGMNAEAATRIEKRMKAIREAIDRSHVLKQAPADLDYRALSGNWGIQVYEDQLQGGRIRADWNIPFTDNCEDREAQVVESLPCGDGILELLVYEKWGGINMNLRWRALREGEGQEIPEISPEEAEPVEAEKVIDAMAALRSKFGQTVDTGTTPELVKEPKKVAVSQEKPAEPDAPAVEKPAPRPLAEMAEKEIFEEYEGNERQIQEILETNPELDMIFRALETARVELTEAERKLESAITRRDRADLLTGKKAKQEKEKLKTAVDQLREERKAFKTRVKDLEQKTQSLQKIKDELEALRIRQAEIEQII